MSPKKKLLFIVNPFAGHGSKAKIPNLIVNSMDKTKFDYELVFTEYGGHAQEIAKEALHKDIDAVVSVGGDGGLSSHLGIGRNAKKALQILDRFEIKTIDTATLNDKCYVNMAGVGIDGLVAGLTHI